MKNTKKNWFQNICFLVGMGLLIAGAIVMFLWQRNVHTSEQLAASYVNTLRTIIPEPQGAVLEKMNDTAMPALSIDGTDFIGILEMPFYDSALPVCSDWGHSSKYPCRFNGSVYDASIQIGATSQKGQYDFYREISVGDALYFTDLRGNRYAYAVKDIRYEKHADLSTFEKGNAPFTLFIKNIYGFDYILVFCDSIR